MAVNALRIFRDGNGTYGKERDGVAVCVVGQLARLNYGSKVANLLKPLRESTRKRVHVFTALQDGDPVFVNTKTTHQISFDDRMQDIFGDFYHSGVLFEKQDFRKNVSDMLQHFRNYCTEKKLDRVTRVSKHFSQWTGMHKCMALVKKAESNGSQYNVVIKIRDNAIVLTKSTDIEFQSRRGIKTKECSEYGGINDKAAVMAREYAKLYMEGPFGLISGMYPPTQDILSIRTPEQMLAAFVPDKLKIRTSANAIPIVDGRGSCLVPHGKDCYPTDSWDRNVANMSACHK
jgi:hypothetical protein